MGRQLGERDVEAAVKGGSVYAAGGGGWADHGRMLGEAAVRVDRPELVDINELDAEALVATAAAIGAPAAFTNWEMRGSDYVKAVQMVQDRLDQPLEGLMIGQNGRSSTLNGWLPSAMLGTKVVDAVGDMRAHPTGDMGAIGLAGSPAPMIQTAVGGNRAENRYIELAVEGATAYISPVLRKAADMSGGFIASCRNPVPASYVARNAACGGISRALALGEAIIDAERRGGSAVIDAILATTGGDLVAEGTIQAVDVAYQAEQAFDIGTVTVGTGQQRRTLHVMNEYMAVDDASGKRLATFPDIITTLDSSGEPLSVGQLQVGQQVAVLHVDKADIPLASSVLDPTVYPPVERALGIDVARYALADPRAQEAKS